MASDVKWIKITTDMFDNRKIKHLRRLPDGNNIVLIWVMLLTLAGRCNSGGMIFLTENIPYTPKMLADELDFEENTVQLALNALEQLNMIVTDSGFFSIAGWDEYQNIEGMDKIREQNRVRKQRQRAKAALLAVGHVTSRDSHATDIDKERELEGEKEELPKGNSITGNDPSGNSVNKPTTVEINDFFDSVWKLYPVKKGKGQVSDSKKKELYKIGFNELSRAIDRYLQELKKDSDWRKPQNGSTFFNSGYVDYLDKNFVPQEIQEKSNGTAAVDYGNPEDFYK